MRGKPISVIRGCLVPLGLDSASEHACFQIGDEGFLVAYRHCASSERVFRGCPLCRRGEVGHLLLVFIVHDLLVGLS